MSSIGETLRRERLGRNLGLDQISRELKISTRFLEAIEQERFEQPAGGVFAKSFVRQYARYLGLDEDDVAAAVQRILEPPATDEIRMRRYRPIRISMCRRWSNGKPSAIAAVRLVFVAAVARAGSGGDAGLLRRLRVLAAQPARRESRAGRTAARINGRAAAAAVSRTTAGSGAAAAVPQPRSPHRATGAASPTGRYPPPRFQQKTIPPTVSRRSQDGRGTPGNSDQPVRVELTAEEPVWVLAQRRWQVPVLGDARAESNAAR